jgi:hypothetical protein
MVALELVTSLFGAFVGHSLFHLYNMLGNPYGRFLIFKRAVKLAIMGKVTDLIVPSFKRIDAFLREWNIGESDKRDLYLSATNILKDQKGYDLALPLSLMSFIFFVCTCTSFLNVI